MAYVYLRQSSMGQVRNNRESTQRQYALKGKAEKMGWPPQRIRVLDRDLGVSGTDITNREDFKLLVADVSMNRVGAVFALEASRLSRSCSDWHRLVELCAYTDTLMIDEDGSYAPADFNDQLLLGIKGTISQAELHFIRARLHGGRMNKVHKGEYRLSLPVGYRYDDNGKIIKEPDEEIRGAFALFFKLFRQIGSAQGVVGHYMQNGLNFPKRNYTGAWAGKIVWGKLCQGRALEVLKNPAYAGAYVYGRKQYCKSAGPDGKIRTKVRRIDMPSWETCIKEHHIRYISWEEFLENQQMLENNRTNRKEKASQGPAREGVALLHGLLLCGVCGHSLNVSYRGTGGKLPTYECSWKKRNGVGGKYCLSIRTYLVDDAVCARVLRIMKPVQLEIAVKALEELQLRERQLDKQWRMKMERADYEAQLAQRRYEEVDPSNRLVASTLEKRWNDALVAFEEAKNEYEEYRLKHSLTSTPEQKEKVLALAKDFPRLFNSPRTNHKDKKRLLRMLIKDITVERNNAEYTAVIHIRWNGGATEGITIDVPPPMQERIRCPKPIVERIRQLSKSLTVPQITRQLNEEGLRTGKGNKFTAPSVSWIRRTNNILPTQGNGNEGTVADLANKLSVSKKAIYAWIADGVVSARKIGRQYWVSMEESGENQLKLLKNSTKQKLTCEGSAL